MISFSSANEATNEDWEFWILLQFRANIYIYFKAPFY